MRTQKDVLQGPAVFFPALGQVSEGRGSQLYIPCAEKIDTQEIAALRTNVLAQVQPIITMLKSTLGPQETKLSPMCLLFTTERQHVIKDA